MAIKYLIKNLIKIDTHIKTHIVYYVCKGYINKHKTGGNLVLVNLIRGCHNDLSEVLLNTYLPGQFMSHQGLREYSDGTVNKHLSLINECC